MLRKLLFLFVVLPLAVALIFFAVSNRAPVTLLFDPFAASAETAAFSLTLPLFLVLFAVLILGVVLGGLAMWWTHGRFKGLARRAEADLARAREEVTALRQSRTMPAASAPSAVPSLPPPRWDAA